MCEREYEECASKRQTKVAGERLAREHTTRSNGAIVEEQSEEDNCFNFLLLLKLCNKLPGIWEARLASLLVCS